MKHELITNCISYLHGMSAGLLRTGLCIACMVILLSVLILWPLGMLLSRTRVGRGRIPDGVCILLMLVVPTLPAMMLRRFLILSLPATATVYRLLPMADSVGLPCAVSAVIVSCPIVFLTALHAFRRVDTETVLAAQTLGIHRGVILRRVILPQAGFGLAAGVVLAFARAFGESTAAARQIQDADWENAGTILILADSLFRKTWFLSCTYILALLLLAAVILTLIYVYLRRKAKGRR